ncbi:MAG TPA: hypothetical protein VKO35_04940, partial [Acidimicrobiia bacterium]|nr:hypothetical protein [Acidimicrobiia bacterium]
MADARLPGLGVPRLTRPTRFARPATATRRPRAAAEVWFGEPGLARLPGLAGPARFGLPRPTQLAGNDGARFPDPAGRGARTGTRAHHDREGRGGQRRRDPPVESPIGSATHPGPHAPVVFPLLVFVVLL